MILRPLAAIVGIAVLAATAHVTIASTGGYQSPHAVLTIAIAAGVGIGALAIGASWSERRRMLALAIAIALLCGELFGLAMTAERLIAQREQAQAPIRKAAGDRQDIVAEIARLEKQLATATTSPRLTAALETQRRVAETVASKAAERGCASNCRALLDDQVRAAHAEVDAARRALTADRGRIEAILAGKQADLARMVPPASATPLADRLGLPSWMLDVIVASLGAIGANGLAATLLAFGAHRPRRQPIPASGPAATVVTTPLTVTNDTPTPRPPAHRPVRIEPVLIEPPAPPALAPVADIKQHAARYGIERLTPAPGRRLTMKALHTDYRAWCTEIGSEELAPATIAGALAELFAGAGITVESIDGQPVAIGIAIKKAPAQAAMEAA